MKILLAIDGSNCSESAVETLIGHYNPTKTEVLVLHVVESPKLIPTSCDFGLSPMFVQDYSAIIEQWRKEGKELVSRTGERLRAGGFNTTAQLEEGYVKDAILDWAKKWNADLILIGSHGKRGLDRFLLGSVSEAVSRHAACSVEIVRPMPAAA